MKKIISKISLLILMMMMMTYSAFALSTYNDETTLIDQADVLTDDEETKLEELIGKFISENKLDLAIILIDDENYVSPQEDAEKYYKDAKMGYGNTEDGILLYINFATNDYRFITRHLGQSIYTDYGIENITSSMLNDLSNGNYYDSLKTYVTLCDKYAKEFYKNAEKANDSNIDNTSVDNNGTVHNDYAYDVDNQYKPITWKHELIILGVGLLLSTIVLLALKSSMNTAKDATYAGNYIIPGSFKLYRESDKYLYSHTSRTAKPKETSSGGGGNSSGGSSTSSGGFGGGGGKF